MKKQKVIRLLLFILFIFSCEVDDYNSKVLNKEKMLKDYEVFQSIFENANSGLYKYHSKKEVDSVFVANKSLINNNTSFREFYNIIWNVIDYSGSCHNNLAFPEDYINHIERQKIFFPIPLKFINEKLYVNSTFQPIPLGSEIISINTISTQDFISKIRNLVSTDGFNITGKNAFINTDWLAFNIYLALGRQDEFNIKYYNKKSSKIEEITLASVTHKQFIKNYENRFSKSYENRKKNDYSFKNIDSLDLGYLTINTFAVGGPESPEHLKYANFIDSVFVNLKRDKTLNLIVDVRGNGGGNDPNDLLLYSYLTKRNFKENTTAFTLFQNVPFPQYYIDDDIKELSLDLKEEHSKFNDGKYYQNSNFNTVWKPNKNTFDGKIILLIDPFVASAGSLFASLVKSDDDTILIGEETLGGYYGHTGHIPVNYQLPNSKLILTFSIVDLEQDVKKLPSQNYGDGVKPDFEVYQTHNDFLSNTDTQFNFALEKVKEQNTKI